MSGLPSESMVTTGGSTKQMASEMTFAALGCPDMSCFASARSRPPNYMAKYAAEWDESCAVGALLTFFVR
jgi:hypothetical protein